GSAAAGGIIGLMAQGRPTSLVLLLPLSASLFAAKALRPRASRAMVVALVAAMATTVPTTLRHALLVREWIPFTYSGGFNLWVGNNPGANGSFKPVAPASDARANREATTDEDAGDPRA